ARRQGPGRGGSASPGSRRASGTQCWGRSGPRRPAPDLEASSPETGRPAAPSLDSATLPRVWQGIGYRPLPDPAAARALFDFAAVPWPDAPQALAWGAFAAGAREERLVGAVAGE